MYYILLDCRAEDGFLVYSFIERNGQLMSSVLC